MFFIHSPMACHPSMAEDRSMWLLFCLAFSSNLRTSHTSGLVKQDRTAMIVTMQDVLLAHVQYGRRITTVEYHGVFDGLLN